MTNSALLQLRGLNIRMQFAKAKVMRVIDSDKAEREMADVLESTFFSGFLDCGVWLQTPPVMFADEPALLAAWEDGFHSHET